MRVYPLFLYIGGMNAKNLTQKDHPKTETSAGLRLDQPAVYRIQLQGRLQASWASWFSNMQIEPVAGPAGQTITHLTGTVTDQPALHGILNHIRDLGIPLISVQLIEKLDGK